MNLIMEDNALKNKNKFISNIRAKDFDKKKITERYIEVIKRCH